MQIVSILKSPLRSINSLISWIKEEMGNFDAPTQKYFFIN
jgi:hypothetical protein